MADRERLAGQQPAMATVLSWSAQMFLAGHEPAEELDYGESVPMDRRSTLWVSEILGAGRPEQSWDEVPGSGEVSQAQPERGREIGDLGKAGLHIRAAPTRHMARGRIVQPVHHSREIQRDYCPALFQVPQVESTTGGNSR
jgi:hypothetical protein